MATKTERILSYLPGTFKAANHQSPLRAVVDTFGSELLKAENSLAALMRSHWVDHADYGATRIDDLAKIASLYGLAPRPGQSVESFRAHLKQYVKTALDGTVTVQGILRTAACNLGLAIADQSGQLDSWWTRDSDTLTLSHHCGDDAASLLFGDDSLIAIGTPALAASISGQQTLPETLDLTGEGLYNSRSLRIKIDDQPKFTVDLFAASADPAAATVAEILQVINDSAGITIATVSDNRLNLRSPTEGTASRLELEEHSNDASPLLLGLAPAQAKGEAEISAAITGRVDLAGTLDLSNHRFLRLRVDNTLLAEVDCAAASPAATTLDDITTAINTQLGTAIASHDGHLLTLTSPQKGIKSSLVLLTAGANDAVTTLFGAVPSAAIGHDKLPAEIAGVPDLARGVDLSESHVLRIRLNTAAAVNIDCRGPEPSATQLPEIVKLINDALGKPVASHNGRNLILRSANKGVTSKIAVEPVADQNASNQDAAEILLGIRPRIANGKNATRASLHSKVDVSAGINLLARSQLRLVIDQAPPVDITLSNNVLNPKQVSLDELTQAINTELGKTVAGHDGQFLTLQSPTSGSWSRVQLLSFTRLEEKRFTTRAQIKGEAAEKIFGFDATEATGRDGEPAAITGTVNLSRGVDLRAARYLSLQFNQGDAVEIDCAGPRPRATLLDEVIERINSATGTKVASADQQHLRLVAPANAGTTQIKFVTPLQADASDLLLGTGFGLTRGNDATSVVVTGVVDLSAGVDLSSQNTLHLAIDGEPALEINCAGLDPAHTSLSQVATAINVACRKNVATHDGKHLIVFSKTSGTSSSVELLPATADDAAPLLLGFSLPRVYRGIDASAAVITGLRDLSSPIDLSTRRFLSVTVDGGVTLEIDCTSDASDSQQVSLADIITAINTQAGQPLATDASGYLQLTSTTLGLSSRLEIQAYASGDARQALFGEIPDTIDGTAPTAAVLTSSVAIPRGVDLSERQQLLIQLDDQPPESIIVRAAQQNQALAEEIVDAINVQLPGIASIAGAGAIQLQSPTLGASSAIRLLPVRYLLLQEYLPADTRQSQTFDVHHGQSLQWDNISTCELSGELEIEAINGVFGSGLVNLVHDWRIRLMATVEPGETLYFYRHPYHGVEARIKTTAGKFRQPDPGSLEVGPQLLHASVPQTRWWRLSRSHDGVPMLVLNNPLSPKVEILSALNRSEAAVTRVQVLETDLASLTLADMQDIPGNGQPARVRYVGKIHRQGDGYVLVNRDNNPLATLLADTRSIEPEYDGRTVVLVGQPTSGDAPLAGVRVIHIACLFQIRIETTADGQADVSEFYPAVTIGETGTDDLSLSQQLLFGDSESATTSILVRSAPENKDSILTFTKGRQSWRYLECFNSRFNQTHFNTPGDHLGRFAGGFNLELGLADSSHYHYQPPASVSPVFAGNVSASHSTRVAFSFTPHQAGTMRVILPADLPPQFGARFNQSLFALPADKPEKFSSVVTEPPDDPQYLVTVVNDQSNLVRAAYVGRVPLGFAAVTIPFSRKVPLINGSEYEAARVYLREPEVGGFIELAAKAPGVWGNQLSVEVCPAGPALFTLQIHFPGSVFENARQVVLGDPLAAATQESLKPGIRGVLHAKAAGVSVEVTRENCATTVAAGNPLKRDV